jgi:RNA polymerase sigma-70 factor (ECF subfamily)
MLPYGFTYKLADMGQEGNSSLLVGVSMAGAEERSPDDRTGPDEPSDHSLLERFRHGSQDAATQIYLRYAHRLRALAEAQCSTELARRIDAEDIVQSVFGSFFRKASSGYYDVPAGEELWKLFLVIALNKIRAKGAFHRAAKRDIRMTSGGDLFDQAVASKTDQDKAAYIFLQLTINEALERLPPQHRHMVEYRIEGYDVNEIARKSGRSKRTVERILQESLKKLSDLLQEDEDRGTDSS